MVSPYFPIFSIPIFSKVQVVSKPFLVTIVEDSLTLRQNMVRYIEHGILSRKLDNMIIGILSNLISTMT